MNDNSLRRRPILFERLEYRRLLAADVCPWEAQHPFELSSLSPQNGGDGRLGVVIQGTFANENTGYWVSDAGDVNADGIDDVLIGTGSDVGSYVVFGRPNGFDAVFDLGSIDGANGFRMLGGRSGITVSAAGDLNVDGIDDVIVGSNLEDVSYVVFGRSGGFDPVVDLHALDGSDGFKLQGFRMGTQRYRAVSDAGDVNGDGRNDVIIGAAFAGSTGSAYVLFGNTSFPSVLDMSELNGSNGFRIDGRGGRFGESVSAGDVNGDGLSDLLISAFAFGGRYGESYVVFGDQSPFPAIFSVTVLDGTNGFRVPAVLEQHFGTEIASGDVNGDGFDDVIMGAQGIRNGVDPGHTYVLLGKAHGFTATVDLTELDGTNGFVINGIDADDFSGATVSSADLNNDGFDDLLIGALEGDALGTETGEAYVVFGAAGGFAPTVDLASLDGNDGWALFGVQSGDRAGNLVRGAGDFNGDGVEDGIIGAWRATRNGNALIGESYVVFGCEVKPDLVVTSVAIEQGEVQLRWNITTADLSTDSSIELYWSTGDVFDSADTLAYSRAISGADRGIGEYTQSVSWANVQASRDGATHLLLVVDPEDAVAEANEDNNLVVHDPKNLYVLLHAGAFTGSGQDTGMAELRDKVLEHFPDSAMTQLLGFHWINSLWPEKQVDVARQKLEEFLGSSGHSGNDTVVLVGHSYGGHVAYRLASEFADALVTVDPINWNGPCAFLRLLTCNQSDDPQPANIDPVRILSLVQRKTPFIQGYEIVPAQHEAFADVSHWAVDNDPRVQSRIIGFLDGLGGDGGGEGEGVQLDRTASIDVNGDGLATALDVLLVINALNLGTPTARTDVDGDGLTSPRDALIVINAVRDTAAKATPIGSDASSPGARLPACMIDDVWHAGASRCDLGRIADSLLGGDVTDSLFTDTEPEWWLPDPDGPCGLRVRLP